MLQRHIIGRSDQSIVRLKEASDRASISFEQYRRCILAAIRLAHIKKLEDWETRPIHPAFILA